MTIRHPARPLFAALAIALTAACSQTPSAAFDHLRSGDKSFADGKYGDALVAYNHARDLAPHDPTVQRALMRARVFIMADTPARLGTDALDDVRYEAQHLLEVDAANAGTYLTALANVALRRGEPTEARAKLDEALRRDPNCAPAHTALGAMLAATKDGRAQAKVELEAALRTRPRSQRALSELGWIKLDEGDLPGAVEKLEAALREGDDYAVRMALGNARLSQDKPAEAAPHFQRALEQSPKSADAAGALGQALLDAGRPEDAERALRAALALRADQTVAIALGYALARQKKPAAALGVFEQVLAEDHAAALALYGAGTAGQDLGQSEKAIAHYKKLLAIPPEGPKRAALTAMQHDAEARLKTLEAALPAATTSPSAAPAAGAPRR